MTDLAHEAASMGATAKKFAGATSNAASEAASDLAHTAASTAANVKDNLKDKAGDLARSASDTAASFKDKAGDLYDSAVQSTETLAGKVRHSVADFASDATHVLRDTIEEQKSAGAGAIADLARSARETAEGFESQSPQIAGAVKNVASKIEAVSNDVKDKTVSDMVDSMAAFAQRQPLAFLGCGVVAGLVLARLLTPPSRA